MIGPLTVGKKAAEYGFKSYGVPGAVVAGAGGVAGTIAVKKGVEALVDAETEPIAEDGYPARDNQVSDDDQETGRLINIEPIDETERRDVDSEDAGSQNAGSEDGA
ncbi:hypothetical protein ACNS7O_16965 (plasmid) [Haloferacaceae archaeon DSL9]